MLEASLRSNEIRRHATLWIRAVLCEPYFPLKMDHRSFERGFFWRLRPFGARTNCVMLTSAKLKDVPVSTSYIRLIPGTSKLQRQIEQV
jgi:hypothetical protein